jgi:hypothetical protein
MIDQAALAEEICGIDKCEFHATELREGRG